MNYSPKQFVSLVSLKPLDMETSNFTGISTSISCCANGFFNRLLKTPFDLLSYIKVCVTCISECNWARALKINMNVDQHKASCCAPVCFIYSSLKNDF